MNELRIDRCARCGHLVHPPRELCPRCHSSDWTPRAAGPGSVEELTAVEHAVGSRAGGVVLASVRLAAGPVVIAAAEAPLEVGMKVELMATEVGVRARPAAEPGTS